jgi:DUF4097 and DUF4098 domain-containing protein YvlB
MRFAAVLFLIILPAVAVADAMQDIRHLTVSAEGIHTLEAGCGAGFLELRGVKELNKIKATAEIKLEGIEQNEIKQFMNKNLILTLENRGSIAILHSEIKASSSIKLEAKIDLTVEVPRRLNVKISDGSGSIVTSDLVGNLKIDDDTGSIEIIGIEGNVSIEDGSGSIIIKDIHGNVSVKDGSGSLAIDLVQGNVNVNDGSGGMTIQDIDGNVTVKDGSGSITINKVTKNVFISETGSGTLEIDGVKGKVTVRE